MRRLVAALAFVVLVLGATGTAVAADTGTDGPLESSGAFETQSPDSVTIAGDVTAGDPVLVDLEGESFAPGQASVADLQTRTDRAAADLEGYAATTDGVTVEATFWIANVALVSLADGISPETLAYVDGVEAVTPNAEIEVATPDTQPSRRSAGTAQTDLTWGLDRINATEVWETYDTRGENASVAVLDSGADPSHPDIDLTEWAEFDFYGDELPTEPTDYDPGGHGTHVSATVTGGNASGQHIGVAPEADLYHSPVLPTCSTETCIGYPSQILAGMQWAVESDVDVISMSLGFGYFAFFTDALQDARAAGTTVVPSIGNEGVNASTSPGNLYNSFSIGAANDANGIATFSSGEYIETNETWLANAPPSWPDRYAVPDVSAPGVGVESALPGGGYGFKSGTSMAAPHVAGTLALAESAIDAEFTPGVGEQALTETAWIPANNGVDDPAIRYGSGIINATAAIEYLETAPVALFSVATDRPTVEQPVTVDASGTYPDAVEYSFSFSGDGTATTVTDGPVATHTFETPGEHTVSLAVETEAGTTDRANRTVEVTAPSVGPFDAAPSDVDGDGFHEDINGDGVFSVADVQALFVNREDPTLATYPEWFDFDGDGAGAVTVADVQALFEQFRDRR